MAFNKLKSLLGDEAEVETEETTYSQTTTGTAINGNQMFLVEPRAYSESQTIADHLKAKNTVVVNLKRVTAAQAKRIIDFLTGTLYAIGGDMQKIGPGIYLCAPKDVKVQGKISEADEDKSSKDNDEEIDW